MQLVVDRTCTSLANIGFVTLAVFGFIFCVMLFYQSIFYYFHYIPFLLHRNHMGCENSQLIQNLPNDQGTIEKTAMFFDKICDASQEDKENCQNIVASLKTDGNRTTRNDKPNESQNQGEINQQTNIYQESVMKERLNGTREGCGLSKFAVPRCIQLPDLSRRKEINNTQQNIQVGENQTSAIEEDKLQDLMAAIVVDNAIYTQRDPFYENCQRQCVSQEIRSEQLAQSQAFSTFDDPQHTSTSKLSSIPRQIETTAQREEVQCFPSSLSPNCEAPAMNNLGFQLHNRQRCNSNLSSENSIASSRYCEPLIVILTEKGETISHQY